MTFADLLNPPAITPPPNSPNVRRVALLGDETDRPELRSLTVSAPKAEITVGDALLNKARSLIEKGPLTVCYLATHAGMSRTHAQRALRELLEAREIVELQIRGVRAYVYCIRDDAS